MIFANRREDSSPVTSQSENPPIDQQVPEGLMTATLGSG
jgi:hypothetical protein